MATDTMRVGAWPSQVWSRGLERLLRIRHQYPGQPARVTGLLRFVLKMPDCLVFGRILPAHRPDAVHVDHVLRVAGLPAGAEDRRTDVCALPSGISVPHMFIVTFVIMLPIALKTGDPIKGGSRSDLGVRPELRPDDRRLRRALIRKITPRAALLGTLAGVSITFISMRPALEMFMTPVIGLTCFAIILVSWFGGVRYGGIPAGLVAIAVGMLIAWGSNLFGLNFGGMSLEGFRARSPTSGSTCRSGLRPRLRRLRIPRHHSGHRDSLRHLRSGRGHRQRRERAAAGDAFPTTRVLTADGSSA